uniref:Secreted protein n=1 Tax=Rhipicephalus zambeziensis TaxID=60191 RepID=A0A224Y5R7_9ACAR
MTSAKAIIFSLPMLLQQAFSLYHFQECHIRCVLIGECHSENASLSCEALHKMACRVKVFTVKSIHQAKRTAPALVSQTALKQVWCRKMPNTAKSNLLLHVSSHMYHKRANIYRKV